MQAVAKALDTHQAQREISGAVEASAHKKKLKKTIEASREAMSKVREGRTHDTGRDATPPSCPTRGGHRWRRARLNLEVTGGAWVRSNHHAHRERCSPQMHAAYTKATERTKLAIAEKSQADAEVQELRAKAKAQSRCATEHAVQGASSKHGTRPRRARQGQGTARQCAQAVCAALRGCAAPAARAQWR